MRNLRMDNDYRVRLMRPFGTFTRSEDRVAAAKEWAKAHQYGGARGGWIYDLQSGKTDSQGWESFFANHRYAILNALTVKLTAFGSFREMVEETHPSYRPSIYPYTFRERLLADEYDQAQERRHDPRRAYVGFDRYDRSLWETMRRAIASR